MFMTPADMVCFAASIINTVANWMLGKKSLWALYLLIVSAILFIIVGFMANLKSTILFQSIAVIVSKYIRYIDVLCTHRYKKKYNKLLSILHR